MDFWHKMFGAVVCWFLTLVAAIVVLMRVTEPGFFTTSSLWLAILVTLGISLAIVATIVGTLYIWMCIWRVPH